MAAFLPGRDDRGEAAPPTLTHEAAYPIASLVLMGIGVHRALTHSVIEGALSRAAADPSRHLSRRISLALSCVQPERLVNNRWSSPQSREALTILLTTGLASWPGGVARLTAAGSRAYMRLQLDESEIAAVSSIFAASAWHGRLS
jgi:hypothetical protein